MSNVWASPFFAHRETTIPKPPGTSPPHAWRSIRCPRLIAHGDPWMGASRTALPQEASPVKKFADFEGLIRFTLMYVDIDVDVAFINGPKHEQRFFLRLVINVNAKKGNECLLARPPGQGER